MTIDTQKLRETATTAVADTLWCTYDCLRVWEAWSAGTMGPDDFSMVVEDEDRLAEITDAALSPALAVIDAQAAEIERLKAVANGFIDEITEKSIQIERLRTALSDIAARAALAGEPNG